VSEFVIGTIRVIEFFSILTPFCPNYRSTNYSDLWYYISTPLTRQGCGEEEWHFPHGLLQYVDIPEGRHVMLKNDTFP
jgi:hypothetical protein